ncbi:hypothetical protein BYT27DRAFT_7233127 [Phlegmacium glaucopus]|nr:hypothetical protein BYT27DRAFT_7233127 [Phlegmacium glaucopus]
MVYVNNKKFACESCIKGHRSSACHHTDRPLFEIKKKGRPVSQCTKCRELRQSKKLHSKCTCDHKTDAPLMQPLATSSGSKPRRFIPIIPALPNGLKDVIAASQSSTILPPDSRQRVDSLLNPCNCKSVWNCSCDISQSDDSPTPILQISVPFDGLATLARAAAMQCTPPEAGYQPSLSASDSDLYHSRPATPNITSRKRQKQIPDILVCTPGPDLAPIRFSPSSSFPPAIPDFPSMPSMSQISSFAGSGCTCGVLCACPGCVEHTDPENDTSKRKDCGEGCGVCIDHSIEAALPDLNQCQGKESISFLDRFFARAAALPPPPAHRMMNSYHQDPMNRHIYASTSKSPGLRPFAFGVTNLPKLECCGGGCICPTGQCTCRDTCAGSCKDVAHDQRQAENAQIDEHTSMPMLDNTMPVPTEPRGNCCS